LLRRKLAIGFTTLSPTAFLHRDGSSADRLVLFFAELRRRELLLPDAASRAPRK